MTSSHCHLHPPLLLQLCIVAVGLVAVPAAVVALVADDGGDDDGDGDDASPPCDTAVPRAAAASMRVAAVAVTRTELGLALGEITSHCSFHSLTSAETAQFPLAPAGCALALRPTATFRFSAPRGRSPPA